MTPQLSNKAELADIFLVWVDFFLSSIALSDWKLFYCKHGRLQSFRIKWLSVLALFATSDAELMACPDKGCFP